MIYPLSNIYIYRIPLSHISYLADQSKSRHVALSLGGWFGCEQFLTQCGPTDLGTTNGKSLACLDGEGLPSVGRCVVKNHGEGGGGRMSTPWKINMKPEIGGCENTFLLGRPIFRGELLVLGRVEGRSRFRVALKFRESPPGAFKREIR